MAKTQSIEVDITPRFDPEALIVMAETYEQAASVLRDGADRLRNLDQPRDGDLQDTFSGWCRGPDGSNTCTLRRFHEGECEPEPVSPLEDSPSTGDPS